jgi:endonuclease/exonuclease/phosphatase (EEP) superfamily protein YafD
MNLLSYNIYKNKITGADQILTKLINSYDFVLVQEWIDSIEKSTNHYYTENLTFKIPFKNCYTGTAIISKYVPKEQNCLVTKNREGLFFTREGSIINTYEIGDQTLQIVNIHGINFTHNHAWNMEICNVVKNIRHDCATIFAGDFNTWNTKRFNFLSHLLAENNFQHIQYQSHKRFRLDHIFSRSIQTTNCTCLSDLKYSDHMPISLEFTLTDN